jgi:hypothetical protein
MEQKLPKKLQWVKAAFERQILLKDNDQVVGKLSREMLSSDIIAQLGTTHLLFDVRGFLKRKVEVKDLTKANTIIATIEFSWGTTAKLQLKSGEYTYGNARIYG